MHTLERTARIVFNFKDVWNVRDTGKAILEYLDDAVTVDIPAYKGDKGDRGEPGPSPVYRGTVDTEADLVPLAEKLTSAEIGHWWGVQGSSAGWIWDGRSLLKRDNWIGAQGATGPMPTLRSGTFTSGPKPGGSIVEVSPGAYEISIVSQKGDKGDKGERGDRGPAASIVDAADFTKAPGAQAGDAILMKADGTFTTGPNLGLPLYTIQPAQFSTANVTVGSSTVRAQLGQITIPAQAFAWRPSLSGRVRVRGGVSTRIDIEVRQANPETGVLVGYGMGSLITNGLNGVAHPVMICTEYAGNEPIDPTKSIGRIPAGQETTFYVSAVKAEGFWDAWQTYTDHATLEIVCVPTA
ncbi:hypothetical protein IU500_12465 [Nocardia terpenica]|uniref:hypothetical protein n=1 Tax=Nocardia terpenica TaxID=455432 RepID=UPI001894424E|nr:hypothetical protein [Nocardia terpenica]MBF6063009.1 hypothetical protein [Nocardia terpenica]MBF6104856.1 hypothetical protein [Nocardia terpenica]MBF6112707.1 hypothetical protein [Nocardia terpenica]MBF6118584.1 hypothetical protein [Nocardia terpenica]MBF6155063.1 hypothetical protein [Nocardia terpenica]